LDPEQFELHRLAQLQVERAEGLIHEQDLGWKGERAGLTLVRLQRTFMPAGDASLKTAQVNQKSIDSDHGIYRDRTSPKREQRGLIALFRSDPGTPAVTSAR
jgi:hypothetical protein